MSRYRQRAAIVIIAGALATLLCTLVLLLYLVRPEVSVPLSSAEVFDDPDARQLARAAARGNVRRIDRLLDRGVDANHRGRYGITPLWWAMVAGNAKGFAHLLDRGADPNAPIEPPWPNIMNEAAMSPDSRFLKAALAKGGDPNLVGGNLKEPPLFYALSAPIHNTEILIHAGADVNHRKEFSGVTPAMAAASTRRYDIAYLLLEHGTDTTVTDRFGRDLEAIIRADWQYEWEPFAMKILAKLEEMRAQQPE